MTYTPNVPQANQTISGTQQPILNNFGYINTTLQVEHVFNGNASGQADGTHNKVSMPSRNRPTLPAGCQGTYYVKGGQAWYTGDIGSGIIDVQLSLTPFILGFTPFLGTVNGVASGGTATIVPTSPASTGSQTITNITGNIGGYLQIYQIDGVNRTSICTFLQILAGSEQSAQTIFTSGTSAATIIWTSNVLKLVNNGGSSHNYFYQGWLYPTV